MTVAAYAAWKHDYPRERESMASMGEIFAAFKKGIWPIGAPVLLIGGMVGGFFTPTEASLVTVVYILILVFVFYRSIKIRDLPPMLKSTAARSSIPLFCLACANVYGYLLGLFKVPDAVGSAIIQFTSDPSMIRLMVICMFLVIGTFMDGVPAIIILLPITRELVEVAHINPLHMGAVVCVTIALGLPTPPYSLCTVISCGIAGIEMNDGFRPMMPMFFFMLIVVVIMGLFPELVLFLPKLRVPDLMPPGR